MNGIIENQIRISSTQFNKLEEYCEVHGIAERYRQALDNLIRICKFPAQEYEDIEGDGVRLYMKTITFDSYLSVTAKAKTLVGKKVRTSCWDPIREPGKWSSQGYFRNVYALRDGDLN